jgi:hypothetical protein
MRDFDIAAAVLLLLMLTTVLVYLHTTFNHAEFLTQKALTPLLVAEYDRIGTSRQKAVDK